MWFTTEHVALTSGVGTGGSALNAFDDALRKGGISDFNLIKVSSIVPPAVPVSRMRPGAEPVRGEGLMVPTIYAEMHSDEIGTELAVAVGAGFVEGATAAGIVFVSECHGTAREAEELVTAMVSEGMEAKGLVQHEVKVASTGTVVKRKWTSVIAAAIFMDATIKETVAADLVLET